VRGQWEINFVKENKRNGKGGVTLCFAMASQTVSVYILKTALQFTFNASKNHTPTKFQLL